MSIVFAEVVPSFHMTGGNANRSIGRESPDLLAGFQIETVNRVVDRRAEVETLADDDGMKDGVVIAHRSQSANVGVGVPSRRCGPCREWRLRRLPLPGLPKLGERKLLSGSSASIHIVSRCGPVFGTDHQRDRERDRDRWNECSFHYFPFGIDRMSACVAQLDAVIEIH